MAGLSSALGNMIHALLWFLPEEKRKRWRFRLAIGGGVILLLVVAFIVAQRIGPTADGPSEDPFERLNRLGRTISPNAADSYLSAIESRTEPPAGTWVPEIDRSSEPLSAELVAWLDDNARSIELTQQAAQIDKCFYPLTRNRAHTSDMTFTKKLKQHARFISLRARHANERHDLEALTDSLHMLARMSQHARREPGIAGDLMGLSILGLAMDHCLSPYMWPEFSVGQRTSYAKILEEVLAPPPNLVLVLGDEREGLCWLGGGIGFAKTLWLYPSERWYGEIDRAMSPFFELAAQPVYVRLDPANPLWAEIPEMAIRTSFGLGDMLSLARSGATGMVARLTPYISLRGRFVAHQRGLRTVVAIMSYAEEHDRWPESLVTLGGDDIIDPYTGAPFHYRIADGAFLIYSAGIDRDDDGGKHHERFGDRRERIPKGPSLPPDGDYVFWPLPDTSSRDSDGDNDSSSNRPAEPA
ncbi:MAG: hypothetical protein GY842_11365 [bacterium]|nr:hypothetical protein [bacterium]